MFCVDAGLEFDGCQVCGRGLDPEPEQVEEPKDPLSGSKAPGATCRFCGKRMHDRLEVVRCLSKLGRERRGSRS